MSQITYQMFLEFLSARYGETTEKIKEANSFGEIGLDSLSLFSLLEDIEETYQIKIDTDDLTEIDTVEKMYCHIEKSIKGSEK